MHLWFQICKTEIAKKQVKKCNWQMYEMSESLTNINLFFTWMFFFLPFKDQIKKKKTNGALNIPPCFFFCNHTFRLKTPLLHNGRNIDVFY